MFDGLEADFGVVILQYFAQSLPHFFGQVSLICKAIDVSYLLSQCFLFGVDLAENARQVPNCEGIKGNSKTHSDDSDGPLEVSVRIDISVTDCSESAECPVNRSQVQSAFI